MDEYAKNIIGQVRETQRAISLKSVEIADVCEWVLDFIGNDKAKKPIALTCDAPTPVTADVHFLRLAVLNIVQNAIKFARPGEPATLKAFQVASQHSQNVITKFSDHGQGLAEEEMRRIFSPFVRGKAQTQAEKGFGLGLSMVAKVIMNMNGSCWAEANQDGTPGLTICIELPKAT